METKRFMQIGVTALRDPLTGGFQKPVPLYIEADAMAEESRERLMSDIGKVFAKKFAQYVSATKEAGVVI